MNLTIRTLTPELAPTFADYLGGLDFSHAPHWATCFCRFYYRNDTQEEWMARSGEMNRAEAMQEIAQGNMTGYLAFDGNACVGWCNAADLERLLRLREDMRPYCADKRVGCVICFVIHPEFRGRGVARALLAQAVQDFAVQGYEAVIALPFEGDVEPQKRYRGTHNMYEELGFRKLDSKYNTSLMWKDMKD